MRTLLVVVFASTAALAAEGFHVTDKIKIGGAGAWDYLTVDSAAHRLYVSHGTGVEVIDTDSGKVVGQIADTQGVHGIAIAPALNKGFTSNGRTNNVTVFDLKTLQKTGEVATGTNPDAICYEPKTQRVFTFNGRSNDATAIDAKSNMAVATFAVGPKPEFCAVDGAGKIYVNIENSNEIVEIDPQKPDVTRRSPLAPCEAPSGLAIDTKAKKLFAVCSNKVMAVVDTNTLKVTDTPPIGAGPDAAAFDSSLGLAFSSNGQDGTITIVKPTNGKYDAVETIPTERTARTMALDERTHRIYLSAAEFGPAPEPKEGQKKGRGAVVPDSFHIVVVGK
ncbi:MAG: YVTN family beta-propeller domain-containing protein [Terriglobia bacterium]|nr:MAG: YVTN family beta-propeller domain-containing protein [Terriglobia bacterium]